MLIERKMSKEGWNEGEFLLFDLFRNSQNVLQDVTYKIVMDCCHDNWLGCPIGKCCCFNHKIVSSPFKNCPHLYFFQHLQRYYHKLYTQLMSILDQPWRVWRSFQPDLMRAGSVQSKTTQRLIDLMSCPLQKVKTKHWKVEHLDLRSYRPRCK